MYQFVLLRYKYCWRLFSFTCTSRHFDNRGTGMSFRICRYPRIHASGWKSHSGWVSTAAAWTQDRLHVLCGEAGNFQPCFSDFSSSDHFGFLIHAVSVILFIVPVNVSTFHSLYRFMFKMTTITVHCFWTSLSIAILEL